MAISHSKTKDLPAVCRRADLLVAAIGRPEMVRGDWIKPGATVIDVGINRVSGEGEKTRIVGDVAHAEAVQVAGVAVTPVPGGVGPMTIACLLLNILRAACAQSIRSRESSPRSGLSCRGLLRSFKVCPMSAFGP
jgi:methylenetetrahydrofolate dehydrogenase (NADP+) / methenyltetrahydrofolate cyclohydrolase